MSYAFIACLFDLLLFLFSEAVALLSSVQGFSKLSRGYFCQFFFDQIKVNYLTLHFLQKISQNVKKRASY